MRPAELQLLLHLGLDAGEEQRAERVVLQQHVKELEEESFELDLGPALEVRLGREAVLAGRGAAGAAARDSAEQKRRRHSAPLLQVRAPRSLVGRYDATGAALPHLNAQHP